MDVRTGLIPSENRNLLIGQSLHREHVDRKVQSHPRRVSANRGRPNARDQNFVRIAKQDAFADHLCFVVVGDWNERKLLGNQGFFLDSVDASRACEDELSDFLFDRHLHQLHARQGVDFPI